MMRIIAFALLYVVFAALASAAEIKTSIVRFVSGADTVSAYLAEPASSGKHPALIVIHEWWGLTDWIKQDARDLAQKGYVAVAIDLYRGALTNDPQEAYKIMMSVPHDRGVSDLKAAFDYLAGLSNVNSSKIGVIGWCMGGSYSFIAAVSLPKIAACVIDYGKVDTTALEIEQINCPVLCNFAELDKAYTPAMGKAFVRVMKVVRKKVELHIYPAVNHAFMNPNNTSGYNEKQSKLAWERIYAFLKKNLK